MPKLVLGELAKSEIRESIKSCTSAKEIAAEAKRLSRQYGVSLQRIYDITRDLRPRRKQRSDRGRRIFDVETSDDAKLIYGWVDTYGISASEAIEIARRNGINVPISFATLNRYLRQDGFGKKNRHSIVNPHRRFEAANPGDVFQFDISGLKTRWCDIKTRRIITVSNLDVSDNHPNQDPSRVRVWRFSIIDDFSRRTFIRYYGVQKPNSSHVVDFLLQAFSEMGIPKILYTDNDAIIVGGRNRRATEILNKLLRDSGGYKVLPHVPGNARATGKVERLHKTIEQEEKVLGLYIAERGSLTLDVLNEKLAVGFMNRKNNQIHSSTGMTPMARWHSRFSVVRKLDYQQLKSAFMADEFYVRINGDCTIKIKGTIYQLPTAESLPFTTWAQNRKKIRVCLPDEADFFTVIDDYDLTEYDVRKVIAKPDTAFDWKSTPQSRTQRLRKIVRETAHSDAKNKKSTAQYTKLPYIDDQFESMGNTSVVHFPKPELHIEAEDLYTHAPSGVRHDQIINFWDAVARFADRFETKSEAKRFFDELFTSRDDEAWLLLSDVEKALQTLENNIRESNIVMKAV